MDALSLLAFDLGAESGRSMLGTLREGRLSLQALNRFSNEPIRAEGCRRWDTDRLFAGMTEGLALAAEASGGNLASLAVDTWGVDFGLVDDDGALLERPVIYRDPRNDGAMESFFERVPREKVYALTGIQFLPFNTLFQLHVLARDKALPPGGRLLFMPDLFTRRFGGAPGNEYTIATTSQLLNAETGLWDATLLEALGLDAGFFHPLVPPGTRTGILEPGLAEAAGLGEVPVVATASHDTASAVAAVPAEDDEYAYISSGTWSLMGVERATPLVSDKTLAAGFTHEGGIAGYRFLKNIMGLWLLQQCRKAFVEKDGRERDYGTLSESGREAEPFRSLVDPDWSGFMNPEHMPEAIRERCSATGEPEPDSEPRFVRCVLESLALKYRHTLEQLRAVHDRPVRRIHVIGGGARNEVLLDFTASATGLPVYAGPFEATAVGNLLVQALALGHLESVAELRAVIRRSFPPAVREPRDREAWDEAYGRFCALIAE